MPAFHIRSVQLLAISAGPPGEIGRAAPARDHVGPLTDHRPLADAPMNEIYRLKIPLCTPLIRKLRKLGG